MDQANRLRYLLHSEEHYFRDLVANTQKYIRYMLSRYKSPYVSFSGGKDSTVLLHMVAQIYPEIDIWHWDYGKWLMPRPFEQEILRNAKIIAPAANIYIKYRPGGDSESARHSSIHESGFFEGLKESVREHNWDLCLLSIRAEESVLRRDKIAQSRSTLVKKTDITDTCYPIGSWRTADIWAYIISNDLPYLGQYDELLKFKSGYDDITLRLSTFFDDEIGDIDLHNLVFSKYRVLR